MECRIGGGRLCCTATVNGCMVASASLAAGHLLHDRQPHLSTQFVMSDGRQIRLTPAERYLLKKPVAPQLAQSALKDRPSSRIIVTVALTREGCMLDKQSPTTESAPAWRILRFFGLDNRRDKESPTADKRPPREPEDRKHQFAIWYFFAAFLGLMLIQYLWVQYSQIETIPYRAAPRSE